MSEAEQLANVSKDLFDRVWAITLELDEMERHFNELQSKYRSLASAWLLASFGGIGFALSEKVAAAVPREAIVVGVAMAGALGIFLLWLIDLRIYHELLVAGYGIGRDLERQYPWLPQRRARISQALRSRPARLTLVWFYISGIEVLLAIAAVSCLAWESPYRILGAVLVGLLALAVAVLIYNATLRSWLLKVRPDASDERRAATNKGRSA